MPENTDPADVLDTELPADDTFPRAYVEKLRTEAAGHRTARRDAEAARDTAVTEAIAPLQQQLHRLLVAGTEKLADPTDLPFDAAHLDDAEKLAADIDALLASKPHLARRKVAGDIGQGGESGGGAGFSLAGALSRGA